jgi:hypothetical protein
MAQTRVTEAENFPFHQPCGKRKHTKSHKNSKIITHACGENWQSLSLKYILTLADDATTLPQNEISLPKDAASYPTKTKSSATLLQKRQNS